MTELLESAIPDTENSELWDDYFNRGTQGIIDSFSLNATFQESQNNKLRAITIDCDDLSPESARRINRTFPSGTFLFHSAKTSSIVSILRSGFLMNSAAIDEGSRDGNGGSEGISWSISEIEAMPATRYHIAGFVASPETVLGEGTQLAVPDSAAPYEVVQSSRLIDADMFYETYSSARSLERDYLKSLGEDEQEAAKLRSHILANKAFLAQNVNSQTAVRVPSDQLYFVAPRQDVEVWYRVLARCGTKPAGIITYDSNIISREDFVQSTRGDGRYMTDAIRRIIPYKKSTVSFSDLIGRPFEESMRNPFASHIMDDEYRKHSKRVV